jgi:phosphoribosylformylglycinamidine synthase
VAQDDLILAYHDRADGGLFATLCEMAFASKCGLSVMLDTVAYDQYMNDVDGLDKRPDSLKGRFNDMLFKALFSEELGAVIQIRRADRSRFTEQLRAARLSYHFVGEPNDRDELRFWRNAKLVFSAPRAELLQTWSETSYQIARLRDDAECAKEEFEALADVANPGLSVALSFDAADDIAAPFIATGARPKIAILREQGVNSQAEMAAAFERAGFAPFDVHMSDLQAGRVHLADFKGLAACGGFSYGDVLGAGRAGPSPSCSTLLREQFEPSSSAPTPSRWAFATAAR